MNPLTGQPVLMPALFQQAVGDPFGKVGFITHVRNVMSSISCFSMNAWSDDKEREGGKCQNAD